MRTGDNPVSPIVRHNIMALCGLWLVVVLPLARPALANQPGSLPNTRPLSTRRPLVEMMVVMVEMST